MNLDTFAQRIQAMTEFPEDLRAKALEAAQTMAPDRLLR
jgi:hypothetical protein